MAASATTPDANFTGSDTFTYKVNDGVLDSNTVTVTIDVGGVNDAPVIISTAPATATEDVLYTYSPAATDADLPPDTLTWSLSGQPADMTINTVTGEISWTPAEGVSTSGALTLTVSDGAGGTDSETFTVAVTAVNDAPVIISTAPATADRRCSLHLQSRGDRCRSTP